jgi:hypothetical protein
MRVVGAGADVLALLAGARPGLGRGGADGPAPASRWLDDPGTAVLGFGLLRVSPERTGAEGVVRIRYGERPSDYASFDSVQLLVLPADAFEKAGRAFAGEALAFSRSPQAGYDRRYETSVSFAVPAARLVVVGFGPFVGPDTGRPLTLARAYTLEVEGERAAWRWVDAEAGELNVKGWTNRPDVPSRGEPVADPVTGLPHWFEVRPLVVFDRERVRAPGDGPSPEAEAKALEADALERRAKALEEQGKTDVAKEVRAEALDLRRNLAAEDGRLPLPADLAAKLRRLPFRWK